MKSNPSPAARSLPSAAAHRALARRGLLQGLGITAASLGLQRWRPRTAEAAVVVPKRFVVIWGGCGGLHNLSLPIGVGGRAPTETEWDFNVVHKPLAALKAHTTYVSGLGGISGVINGNSEAAHVQTAKDGLTAAGPRGAGQPRYPSIDQYLAERINSPNPVTRFKSLEFIGGEIMSDGLASDAANALHTSTGAAVSPIVRPALGFQKAFGNFVAPEPMMPTGPTLADVLREQQLEVLGFARDEYGFLKQRLGRDDRNRLEVHLDLLNDLDKQMRLSAGGTENGTSAACSKPSGVKDGGGDPVAIYNATIDGHSTTLASALACDLTRVGFLGMWRSESTALTGFSGNQGMHEFTHQVDAAARWNDPNGKEPAIKAIHNEATKVAAFLQKLRAIPTADGKDLLFHSIVLWASEIGYGNHDMENLPWPIFGNAGGGLRSGRFIDFRSQRKMWLKTANYPPNWWYKGGSSIDYNEFTLAYNRPHNDLYVSFARLMGFKDVEKFGLAEANTGPITELGA